MEEELLNYLYKWAQNTGYKKSREDFVKLIQSDEKVFNHAFNFAQKDGYKKDADSFALLVGRTKPQVEKVETASVEQPARVEPKVEPKVESQVTETVTAKTEEPVKEPIVEEKPAIQVKEVEAPKEEVVKKEIPAEALNQNIIPITDKTEIKTVETPSDKVVVKSEKKEEVKEQPKAEEKPKMEMKDVTKEESNKLKIKRKSKLEPIDIKLITKIGSDNKEEKIELIDVKPLEPSKKYKPYGEKGPDVYYSEDYDQYIVKDGEKRTIIDKGSEKYNELDSKIGNSAKGTIEGTGKCDPDSSGDSCSKNTLILSDFINNNYDKIEYGWRGSSEGQLIYKLNEEKEDFEEEGDSRYVRNDKKLKENQNEEDPVMREVNENKYNVNKKMGQIWYTNEDLPKDKRFIIYKPYGDDRTLIYDKESEIILKQIDKAPNVDRSKPIYDAKGNKITNEKEIWKNYKKNNPNEGLNVWYGYHKDRPEYKELKSLIEGMDYKKEKGSKNTFVPLTTTPDLTPEWLKNKNTSEQPKMEVKDVTKEETKTPKTEELKGIPSYDDLGINPEKEPGSFLDANKNVKFEKLSPNEIIEKGFLIGIGSDIKLERNKSLRYPDPPGVVFEKEKVGEREVYSSYDKANDKWYIYDENSNKNNWIEVKSGTIKTLLNSKYKKNNKIINSKTDYISEEEEKEMRSMRRSVMLNKYLPYVMKNWDNLSNEQKQKVKRDLNSGGLNILLRKYLESDDPNLDFWLDVNDKFFNNQATSSNAIDVSAYEQKLFEIPSLNKDIKENKIKVLKSVAGDVFYDEKNDTFYYGETFDRGDLKREKSDDFPNGIVFTYLRTITKGTPAYDKIKNSLNKYNN